MKSKHLIFIFVLSLLWERWVINFQFCFEFAMRTMGHQNTTFDSQFSLEFAMRTMGHHVARCSHNKYKVRSEMILQDFEILTAWPGVLIVLLSGGLWRCNKRMPAANLVVYRGYVRLTFPVSLGKTAIKQLLFYLIGPTLRPIVIIARSTIAVIIAVLLREGAWNWKLNEAGSVSRVFNTRFAACSLT